MNNKSINEILFKYILNSTSYIRTLLTILPEEEVSTSEKAVINEIFNLIIKTLSEKELKNITEISNLFESRLSLMSHEDALIQARYIYKTFLRRMMFESSNRRLYFDIMNECIKASTGYYQEYDDSFFYAANANAVGNIRTM